MPQRTRVTSSKPLPGTSRRAALALLRVLGKLNHLHALHFPEEHLLRSHAGHMLGQLSQKHPLPSEPHTHGHPAALRTPALSLSCPARRAPSSTEPERVSLSSAAEEGRRPNSSWCQLGSPPGHPRSAPSSRTILPTAFYVRGLRSSGWLPPGLTSATGPGWPDCGLRFS